MGPRLFWREVDRSCGRISQLKPFARDHQGPDLSHYAPRHQTADGVNLLSYVGTRNLDLLMAKLTYAHLFSYFVTTALGGASGSLLQIVTLVIYYARMFVFGSTPRAVHKIKFELESMEWGTLASSSRRDRKSVV